MQYINRLDEVPYTHRIFVINPGSTSTKCAIYHDDTIVWKAGEQHTVAELSRFNHPFEQLDYRVAAIRKMIDEGNIRDMHFDAVISRGGLLHPTPGGVYEVTPLILNHLENAEMEHVCNLGAKVAHMMGLRVGCPAYIADPEVVDELIPEARVSGLPDIPHKSIFHALNSRAVASRYAQSIGRRYEDLNLIVAHLGGGISVGAHRQGKVIDVNNALNGDGPFTPERAGTLPAQQLVDLCFSGTYTPTELKKKICGQGGLIAHLGTNDVADAAQKASEGIEPYKTVLDAMIYSVAKEIGARYVALRGRCDAILLTGGIANSQYVVDTLRGWVDYLAPIYLRPGEDELGSLAYNALGVLRGQITPQKYDPD